MNPNRPFRPSNWRDGDGELQSAAQKRAGRHFLGSRCCFWRPARIRANAPTRANCRSGSRKFRRKSMPRVLSLAARWLAISALLLLPAAAGAAPVEPPAIAGVPIDFILFALTLIGVALFHHHTLRVALDGPAAIIAVQDRVRRFRRARRHRLVDHLAHEWVLLANLLGSCSGFALLRQHFEDSRVRAMLPVAARRLEGRLRAACMIFVLSSFLDNIAAALIGGTMATASFAARYTSATSRRSSRPRTRAAPGASSATRRPP